MRSKLVCTFVLVVYLTSQGSQSPLSIAQAGGAAAVNASGQAASEAKIETFFPFEHDLWDEIVGAELQLQPLTKYPGNPVIPRGVACAPDSHRVSYTSLFPEGDRLRTWYAAVDDPTSGFMSTKGGIGYAESEDGIHWTKPKLNIVEPGTNLVLRGVWDFVVVPDPTVGGKGYRALVGFNPPNKNPGSLNDDVSFQALTSKDGFHWDFTQKRATELKHFEAYGLFHRNGEWWVLGHGVSSDFPLLDRPHGQIMYGFHSADGNKWELFPLPLLTYPFDPEFPDSMLQVQGGAAVWDRGRIILGFEGQLHPSSFSESTRLTVGLIYTYDAMKWTEPFPQTALPLMPGPEGSWDSGGLMQVQRPVSRGKTTYFYYSGSDGGHVWSAHYALGLATLRRDGFAAFTAKEDNASLVTEPLERIAGETTLYLNAAGRVTVQVLDEYLHPISPKKTIEADDVRIPALDLRELSVPARFRLAFRLSRGTKLYTFSLGANESQLPPLDAWE